MKKANKSKVHNYSLIPEKKVKIPIKKSSMHKTIATYEIDCRIYIKVKEK